MLFHIHDNGICEVGDVSDIIGKAVIMHKIPDTGCSRQKKACLCCDFLYFFILIKKYKTKNYIKLNANTNPALTHSSIMIPPV